MFTINVGQYALTVQRGSLPTIYGDYKKHAKLCEEFALRPHEGELCFVSVSKARQWPFLVVAQRFELSDGGFDPAALLVEQFGTLFLGAGRRLLGYRLLAPNRIFEDKTDAGFLEWEQHGKVILMSGELELAAWDVWGNKLWTMPLQPAWEYHVEGDEVHLDVLGRRTVFDLHKGPTHEALER
ncbi:MAG TPA: hypothetical protein VN541_13140 [Tepidisphaeraceae bacterium]|nr:hypothetical protein [Tepidisphaeraceae bacterium]